MGLAQSRIVLSRTWFWLRDFFGGRPDNEPSMILATGDFHRPVVHHAPLVLREELEAGTGDRRMQEGRQVSDPLQGIA